MRNTSRGAIGHDGPESAVTFAGIRSARTSYLRPRGGHAHQRVEFIELFFDLVFVFAVTQLSHGLLAHLDLAGALQTGFLLLVMWWVWITASWMTNWVDPQARPTQFALFALMLGGLVFASCIPDAFGERAVLFAWAYVVLQLGRTLFMLWTLRRHSRPNYRNFLRILAWLLPGALLWILGAHGPQPWRVPCWVFGFLLEFGSPWWGFWTPGLGRSTTADWDVEGSHMAERCGLFVIIALGESILVTGSTFASLTWNLEVLAAFLAAFCSTVAMWWVYFAIGAERGSRLITESHDPGRLARAAYTYLHVPIVAGIVVTAVADELVLAHPHGHTDLKTALVVLGGPALYLLGNAAFKRSSWPHVPLSHLVGLALLAAAGALAPLVPPLLLAALAAAVLAVVALWEWWSLGRARPSSPSLPATML